jgi:lipoprotein-anchoring transpeptidase ErfK/SrfK
MTTRRARRAPAASALARPLPIALAAAALAGVLATAAPAAAADVSFLQGEQLVTASRPGTGLEASMRALLAGPTPAERRRQVRTYLLPGTPLRSASVEGRVATVDLGARLVSGTAPDVLLARLAQVVGTATSAPGVRSVRVLVEGGTPLGLFPGIDARRALTPRALATPNVAPPPAAGPAEGTPASPDARALQQRLADLGYLPASGVDGRLGPATAVAVIAFQKWQGLARDGVAGPATTAALAGASRPTPITRGGAGRRVEILVDRQLVLAIQDDQVVRAIHVSTGKPSTPTPIGSFSVYGKFPRWWSTPFREWLLWASPFVGGVAMHQYPSVPVTAASHGCVRVTQYDARWLFNFVSVGTPVRVIASSR